MILVYYEKQKLMQLKIKYLNSTLEHIKQFGTWCDLRCPVDIEIKSGEHKLIPLGVCIQLPKNYEALLVSRSSTFKNYGIIQTNAPGIIDESYSGNDDQWFFSIYATRDTVIYKNDRICQFRILKKQPRLKFIKVDNLENFSRGGYGSTGIK